MSQQINLLRPKDGSAGKTLWLLAGVGLVVVGLLGYVQTIMARNDRLREQVAAGDRQLAQVRAALQLAQGKKPAGAGDAASLAAEINALRPRADAVGLLMKEMRSGKLGSPEGFARYYSALANVAEDGLWITNVSVTGGGAIVSVGGRALRNESVTQYARRLNQAFEPYGVHFNSLELTPENVTKPGAGVPPVLSTVAFKLS